MQKLISITKNEFEPLISEDHYIINNILENLLNEEISDLFLNYRHHHQQTYPS